jgi:hypothetical protein
MLSSIVVIGALAAFANAVPVQERQVTITEVTDVYTTVWDDAGAAPTSTVPKQWWWKGGHKHKSSATSAAPVVTTAPAAAVSVPAYTPAAAVSTPETTPAAAVPTTPAYTAPAYTAPAAPSAAPISSSGSYQDDVVAHHNAHRANHSAPALAWDDATAATALKIANSCNYAHDV